MNDKDVEKIIKANMMVQMNLAGIREDFKKKLQRKWVGLTDDEIIDVIHPLVMADMADEATDYEIARAIEAKLKEKNT